MKMNTWITLALIGLIVTACNLPEDNSPTAAPPLIPNQTWIDAPLPNSTLQLLPYKLVFHAASHFGVDEFEVQVNGVPAAAISPASQIGEGGSQGTLFYGEHLWTPPAPGSYLIAVRPKSQGQYGPTAEVQVTVVGLQAELSTPLPLAPTPTSTPTLVDLTCNVTSLVNLFCRPGPGYEPIDEFVPGQSAEAIGFSPDGFYVFVNGPNLGKTCTVPMDTKLVEVSGGGCESLPKLVLPPTPTSTPLPPPPPQCSDEIDNDDDGLIDLADRQCRDADDDDESVP